MSQASTEGWAKGYEADKEHHGGGVLAGRVQPDVGVCCAGSPGHHGETWQLVRLSVGFCHVTGATLVTAGDGLDRRGVQPVQDIEIALSGYHMGAPDPVGEE
ncbi:hypothetical protein ABIB27_003879 [Arthrobacter sp. UYEF21]